MPTPIGHSLCGCAIYSGVMKKGIGKNWKTLFLFIVIANLPDIDYLPGLLINKPNAFHHGFTHSLGFSVIVGTLIGLYYKFKKRESFWTYCLIFLGVYLSHVIFDYVTVDTSFPYGEQLYWPLSKEYFLSPVSIFRDVHKGGTNKLFFRSFFDWYNFITVATEFLIFLPVFGLIRVIKYKKRRDREKIS